MKKEEMKKEEMKKEDEEKKYKEEMKKEDEEKKYKDEDEEDEDEEDEDDSNELQEIKLSIKDINDEISLKKPDEIYYEIYKVAREKAKHMKKVALEAHLEARNIKTKYMLDDLNYSDDDLSESDFD